MLFVVDTSTLIVLRNLDWLELCSLKEFQFIIPSSVTQELKRQKSRNQELLSLLAAGEIVEVEVQQRLRFEEISPTDAEVIALARERQVTILSEDLLLRKKAAKAGLPAATLAAFCVLLYQWTLITEEEVLARLKTLYEKKFISDAAYRQFLLGLMS